MIEQALSSNEWEVIATIESSSNTYYLFKAVNPALSMTIAINSGESDLYNDVIIDIL